jgi:phosphinothricin acetyltransferase
MQIRPALESDVPGVLAIYNDVIATSTAIYVDQPVALQDRIDWFRARRAQGYPVLVAVDETGVAGYASYGDFRAFPGYRYTVEHSVHVRADRRAAGVGAALMGALIPLAAGQGKHMMIAAIDAANTGSIRFHGRFGFVAAGHFREVGVKFGRWLDVVFMQLCLTPQAIPPVSS